MPDPLSLSSMKGHRTIHTLLNDCPCRVNLSCSCPVDILVPNNDLLFLLLGLGSREYYSGKAMKGTEFWVAIRLEKDHLKDWQRYKY
jgi:hypothetical protein